MSAPASAPSSPITFGFHTEVGRRREHNEDSCRCESLGSGALLIVCDGVGGAKAGEVASRMAVDGLSLLLHERLAQEPPPEDRRTWLEAAARELDRRVRDSAKQPGLTGMGATLSVLWVDGDHAWWAQVGDSRIYLRRGGELRQISRDQSPVGRLRADGEISEEDARKHPYKHMIDQCLGGQDIPAEPDTGALPVEPGDIFLLCSDGLADGLWDKEIAETIAREAQRPPEEIARILVNRANDACGNDNITAVVARKEIVAGATAPASTAAPATPTAPQPRPSLWRRILPL